MGCTDFSSVEVTNQSFVVFTSEGMHRVILRQHMNVEHYEWRWAEGSTKTGTVKLIL